MKLKLITKILALVSILSAGATNSEALTLNSYYQALGSINLFSNSGIGEIMALESGSYIQFSGNGDFNYRFDTAKGVVSGKQTFNVQQFLTGAGDLALNTPAGLNLGGGYTSHGTFLPDSGITNYAPFTLIASAMPNVYRLSSSNGSFTLWNAQYSAAGAQLGGTDFWLATGAETQVPEPMTVALLGSGLLGALARRKKSTNDLIAINN